MGGKRLGEGARAIGGASVSSKHANFIVNDGRATAADVEALIAFIRDRVAEQTGVVLETEVRIVGEPLGSATQGGV